MKWRVRTLGGSRIVMILKHYATKTIIKISASNIKKIKKNASCSQMKYDHKKNISHLQSHMGIPAKHFINKLSDDGFNA